MKMNHLLRRGAGVALAIVVLSAAAVAVSAGPAAADITAGEGLIGGPSTQMLEIGLSAQSSLLLTVNGASTAQGALINVYQQTSATNGLPQGNQLWQFLPDTGSDDVFQSSWGELKNVGSGLCLNVAGGSTAELQQLIQWPCVTSSNEEFKTVQTGPKTFGLQSELPGVYLGENDQNCLAGNNTRVLTRASYGNPCTDWTIQRIGGQPVTLPNNHTPGRVIDSNNPGNNWLVPAITTTASTSSSTQTWYLQRAGSRTVHAVYLGGTDYGQVNAPLYRLVSVRGNNWAGATCLELPGGQPAQDAQVETYGCDANAVDQSNQLWILAGWNDLGGGSGAVVTSTITGVGSGAMVMFNDALIGANQTTLTYPVLSIVSTIAAFDGSTMAMQPQNSTVLPADTQLWRIAVIPPASNNGGGNNGGGSTPPPCVGFGCLLN